jgi:hypothetical protein
VELMPALFPKPYKGPEALSEVIAPVEPEKGPRSAKRIVKHSDNRAIEGAVKWSHLTGHSDNLTKYQGGQYGQEEGSQVIQRRV